MQTHQIIPGFKRRMLLLKAGYIIPGICFFVLAYVWTESPASTSAWQWWLGVFGCLVCVCLGAVLELRKFRVFECPSCGHLSKRSDAYEGHRRARIVFHCTHCDVLWHTGFFESDS